MFLLVVSAYTCTEYAEHNAIFVSQNDIVLSNLVKGQFNEKVKNVTSTCVLPLPTLLFAALILVYFPVTVMVRCCFILPSFPLLSLHDPQGETRRNHSLPKPLVP